MEKPNLNVMIFDDDQEPVPKNDIKKYSSQSKSIKPSTSNGHSSEKNKKKAPQNDKISIISKQISELHTKIKTLQKNGQKIKSELQKRNESNQGNSPGGNSSNSSKTKEIQQILIIVEKKIQIIIQESKNLVSKMSQTVDRKLFELQKEEQNKKQKVEVVKDKNKNVLNQIQSTLKQKLQQYENHYRNQCEKVSKQAKRKEQLMMKKLSQMELKFANKLNSFETKQKEYVDWIHHLQAKLKERKSKKMITITQEKPQLSSIQSKVSIPSNENHHNQNNLENVPQANFQTSKVNCSIDQNNSKMIRKHKIFGGKSTSPAPRNDSNVSPTKDSIIPSQPQQKPSNMQYQPSGSSFYQQESKGGHSNLNFYNDLRKEESGKMRQNTHPNEGGWDKFADLNEFNEEYTESESDDFFTPIEAHEGNYERVLANIPLDSRGGTYYAEPFKSQNSYQQNLGYQDSGQKVFSPFDLN